MESNRDKQIELSQDRCVNDINFEEKHSTDASPDITVENIGHDLKDALTDWSNVLRQCKQLEDDTLGQLDDLLKQAYALEADCLKQRLEAINKMIEKR